MKNRMSKMAGLMFLVFLLSVPSICAFADSQTLTLRSVREETRNFLQLLLEDTMAYQMEGVGPDETLMARNELAAAMEMSIMIVDTLIDLGQIREELGTGKTMANAMNNQMEKLYALSQSLEHRAGVIAEQPVSPEVPDLFLMGRDMVNRVMDAAEKELGL